MAPNHYPPEVVVTMHITQVKNHAKGMRSLEQVKTYFKDYRAKRVSRCLACLPAAR